MIEVGTAGKTIFPYHGFQFMSEVTLLPSGISLDIKCIENAIRDYVLANTTEVERLFKFLCSNNWTRDLFD